MRDQQPAPGRLLVATQALADPNFSHTVLLVLEHDGDGTLGVCLNRPSDVDVDAVLPGWQALAVPPPQVFVGGPVQPQALLGLAAGGPSGTLLQPVAADLCLVDLSSDPLLATGEVSALRVFAGYAGWGPGQLADELEAGGWFVVDAAPGDLLSDAPDQLWREVLHRQGGVYRTAPEDPSLN